jgi:4-hydroxy-3-methylbut-2-enyl diphosphate reductase
MLVVGGYNSSNTTHLAALSASLGVRTYHIEDATGIDPEAGTIRHQPVKQKRDVVEGDWLGAARVIGITAGASTPNNKIGETIARVAATAGVSIDAILR